MRYLMKLPMPDGALEGDRDPRELIKHLGEELRYFVGGKDAGGLARVREQARALVESPDRRVRRQAERLVVKASDGIERLRREGIESPDEARAREEQEQQQHQDALERDRAERTTLTDRIVALLHLVLNDGREAPPAVAALKPLLVVDDDGFERVEIPALFASWSPVFLGAYQESRGLFARGGAGELAQHGRELERGLKVAAVDLLAAGAELRNLTTDAVPLVAYALFTEQLPLLPAHAESNAAERIDDLLLRHAEDVSSLPAAARPQFIGLFRLAALIGEAQAYCELVSLERLSIA